MAKTANTRKSARKCEICGKRPIDRNTSGRDSTMCLPCFDYGMEENLHSDENHERYGEMSREALIILLGEESAHAKMEEMQNCAVCAGDDPAQLDDVSDYVARNATSQPKASGGGLNRCKCSADCTRETKNVFAQGHDARMVSLLVKAVLADDITAIRAEAAILGAGATSALVAKFRYALANKYAKVAEH